MTANINHDEGIIRPRKRKTDPLAGTDVVMAMIPTDLDYLVNAFRSKEIAHHYIDFFDLSDWGCVYL